MAEVVAKAYADALFEIALDEKKCNEFRHVLHEIKLTMDERFIQLMNHPKISKNEKKECIDKVYGNALDVIFIHFLKVLVDKNRFGCILSICNEYDKAYIQYFHIIQADVCSARELNEDEKKRLSEMLEKKYQQKVECSYSTDAKLLGGMRVKIGDKVMDNTVLNTLTRLKDRISG